MKLVERIANALGWDRVQFVWWGNIRCGECGKRDWSYWRTFWRRGSWPERWPIFKARYHIGPLEIRVWIKAPPKVKP